MTLKLLRQTFKTSLLFACLSGLASIPWKTCLVLLGALMSAGLLWALRTPPPAPEDPPRIPASHPSSIAPEAMLERWEAWVREKEGDDERVHRVYPRDFWLWPPSGDGSDPSAPSSSG